jgi:PleD family two-component response regulator
MDNVQTGQPKGDILIVDDSLPNLRALSEMLAKHGYEVRGVADGPTALIVAGEEPPDLILLDVNMPGMNGYEVCQRLKRGSRTCDIPVIFISALNEVADKVKGFQVGGVDYISKPFQIEEVLARLQTHLALYHLRNEVEQRVEERTAELAKANASLKSLSLQPRCGDHHHAWRGTIHRG